MIYPAQKNIHQERNRQWGKEFRAEFKSILDWWSMFMVDEQNGGFFGRIDGQNILHPYAEKGIILNTRILWTYAAAAQVTNHPHHIKLANRAYQYFCNHFWDSLEGGVFWTVDFQGNPIDTQKQIYAQAFAIYALSEYYLMTKNEVAIDQATEIFWLVEKYSRDKQLGGYHSAFARDWSTVENIRLSEKDANEAKIMNTHLHVLEAYTNFCKIKPFTALKDALENCLDLFLEKFYIPENGSMHIYFDEKWKSKSENISFGHNIEASWLLWEAAETLNNDYACNKTLAKVKHMAAAVLETGLDKDGSLFYEAKKEDIIDTDKHWWCQAEAVVGFWNAFELTHDSRFANAAMDCWKFIKSNLLDEIHGEWFWLVNQEGIPSLNEDKAGFWKAPYHNVRMCLEMMKRLDQLVYE